MISRNWAVLSRALPISSCSWFFGMFRCALCVWALIPPSRRESFTHSPRLATQLCAPLVPVAMASGKRARVDGGAAEEWVRNLLENRAQSAASTEAAELPDKLALMSDKDAGARVFQLLATVTRLPPGKEADELYQTPMAWRRFLVGA